MAIMFDVEADKYRDLFTIKEFGECVKCGAFIPDDGCGYFGTETHYSYDFGVWSAVEIPAGATHVHWYNK
ncbi:hypothetical protein phiPsa267_142 [Pseudomonas phage phiPsa267]|uniref:Uncharacterized protein n=4 Tax=Otagovirus TaxID=2560197 RepID=A0A7G9V139_9CAUD|nr:hypothetical protein QGX15_gp091 [Pseudomonas phage psageK4e]YP_010767577.1 hypothetical protein QGX18_gp087 [Pseudomonas phage phiPsa347]YP_010767752.1 hypothetical protein QGX19_gp088 [Pseudomonas phage phiPsa267]YP_010767927.1 hypothetical protein QGX20_gp081 [Pseudomonas phage phiPsa300]QNN99994.1 hypothetical protein phiPsa267_142 [Pseudomonas phage phiPsa267]QNO00167.1 hypothetical protein phiPsa300_141 [Pseudomonas phage phiPsa300]QNO00512.1 hypothetical protein phiPsa347_141 [Pseud